MSTNRSLAGKLLGAMEGVVNPVLRTAIRRGLPPRAFALIETTGRKSGRRHIVPVGNGLGPGGAFWLVAEHGDHCHYVLNLRHDPHVRVCVAGHWYDGIAKPRPDDDPLARRRKIDQANGPIGLLDGIIFRSSATTPLSIHIQLLSMPVCPS